MSRPRRLIRTAILSISLGLVLYAVVVVVSDQERFSSALGRVGWSGWALLLSLSLLNYAVRALRWYGYMRALGHHHICFLRHTLYYIAGFAFTTTPAKVGEVVRGWYLKPLGVRYRHTLAAVFVERLLDVVAVALLALLAAFTFEIARVPVVLCALALLVGIWLLHSRFAQLALGWLRARMQRASLRQLLNHLADTLGHAKRLLTTGPLVLGLLLGLVGWSAEAIAFHWVISLLGADVDLFTAVGIYAAAVLVGAVSFIPGGLGSTEVAMVLLLGLNGVDSGNALAATLIARTATLWFATGMGLMTVAGLSLRAHVPVLGRNPAGS